MEISYRFPCRLRVFRQNERTCPSRKTDEKHESSVERSAEGKPSGQTPAHSSPLPQSSVSSTAKCCSITCWACWKGNSATFCNSGFRVRKRCLVNVHIKCCACYYYTITSDDKRQMYRCASCMFRCSITQVIVVYMNYPLWTIRTIFSAPSNLRTEKAFWRGGEMSSRKAKQVHLHAKI